MKGKGKIGERDKEKWEGGEGNKVSCKFIQPIKILKNTIILLTSLIGLRRCLRTIINKNQTISHLSLKIKFT